MKRVVMISGMLLLVVAGMSQPVTENMVREYVNEYSGLAVREMKLYKVPASITLAQAIYASKAGTNKVSKEANNHFGIMCHTKEWTGDTYYETENRSRNYCYRKYADVQASYRDHSLFLAERPHYATLFDLNAEDYRGWAKGLKAAGYSGNARYADTLITLIEQYRLYDYDRLQDPAKRETIQSVGKDDEKKEENKTEDEKEEPQVPEKVKAADNKPAASSVRNDVSRYPVNIFILDPQDVPYKQAYHPATKRPVYENNKTKFLIARQGDTYAGIAETLQLSEKNLRQYNDIYDDSEPVEGEVVYVEMKGTKSPVDYHVLTDKDTYRYIAQKYGVQLKIIVKRNSGSIKNYQEGDRICIGCR